MRNKEFSYPSSCSRNNADSSRYLSSRSWRVCMGFYKRFHAVYVHILIVSSQCDAIGSFTVCIYQFLKRNNEFSYLSSCSRNNAHLGSLFVEQIWSCKKGSYKYFRAVYMHILVVCSKCDAFGSFPLCIYQVL